MKNEYEVRGEVTAIFINSPKYGEFETLISTNKLERVKSHPRSWSISIDITTNSFYAISKIRKEDGKLKGISLHRFITNAPEGMEVDHRNHLTLDNTDSNLRVSTRSENNQNRKGAQKNSISGIRGVHWDHRRNKWRSRIRINKKMINLGSFDNIEEAEQVVIEARMHHMPFSQEASL